MVHVAICDDEKETGLAIQERTEACFQENGIVCRTAVFHNGRDFWYEVDDGAFFDILLLDIEMPGIDGMELTKKIRKLLPDVILTFVSAYKKYVFDVFALNAFRFIPKDQIERRLDCALLDAVRKLEYEKDRYYVIENKRMIEKIPLKQIVSVWRDGKNCVITKVNGDTARVRKSLAQVYEELPHEDFEWVNRGTICNLAQIVKADGEELLLRDGSRVPMVRGRILELKSRIRTYWVEREGL